MTDTAWHNDPELKAEVMARLRQHRAEDSIIQGVYQQLDPGLASGYRGCAIGCTLPYSPESDAFDDTWHENVERLYGIPEEIARFIDSVFEGLPVDQAGDFALNVIDAIPVGADLSLVTVRMVYDELSKQWQFTPPDSDVRKAVTRVRILYRRFLAGDNPTDEEWIDASAQANQARATIVVGLGLPNWENDLHQAAAMAERSASFHGRSDSGYLILSFASPHTQIAKQLIYHLSTAPVLTAQ